MEILNLAAPEFFVSANGGDDATFAVVFPYDATGGVHVLGFATSADGEFVQSYTNSSGLTIGSFANGKTRVTAVLPRSFTRTYRKQTLYFAYTLELSSLLRTQAAGTMTLKGGPHAAGA